MTESQALSDHPLAQSALRAPEPPYTENAVAKPQEPVSIQHAYTDGYGLFS
jgi:hypothetical protein